MHILHQLPFVVVASGAILMLTACQTMRDSDPEDDDSTAVAWEEPVEVALGDGFVGPWRMNQSEFHYVDDPTVAINDNGLTAVVWVDNEQQDVFFQRFDADGAEQLAEPVNVSGSPEIFSWLPRVEMSAGGDQIFVLWEEIIFSGGSHGGDILFARSDDGGETFGEAINLSDTVAGAGKGRLTEERWDNGSLDLARGAGGELYAAWTEYEGALRFSRSVDGGQSFSEPLHITGNHEDPTRAPTLAVGPEETIFLAWTVGDDEAADIHFTSSTDGGESFESPGVAYESGGHSDAPAIVTDSQGTVHLVFGESPGGLDEQYHVHYARLSAGDNAFDEPIRISETDGDNEEGANFASLAIDGSDNLFVIWEHRPDLQREPLGLGFSYLEEGEDSFSSPIVVPGTTDEPPGVNGGLQGKLMRKIAVNENGDIAVVHSNFRPGDRSRVRLIRGEL